MKQANAANYSTHGLRRVPCAVALTGPARA
jgi:hypothetical protein